MIINGNTPVIALPELDIFENVPVQTSIEKTFTDQVLPVSQLNSGAHVEFIVKTAENEFIRPCDAMIQVVYKVKLHKIDKTKLTNLDWDKVAMVNNMADSMWAQIDVSIGDTQTTKPLHTHPYKSYIHTILHTPNEAKETFMKLRGFYDDVLTDAMIHRAQQSRKDRNKDTTTIDADAGEWGNKDELWFPLHVDLFRQTKDLVGGITLKIRLIPSRPEFLFMCEDANLQPSIHFEKIVLHLTQRNINGNVTLGILKGLQISPAKYPMDRVEVRTHTIDSGTTSRNLENIYVGTAPRFALIGFVNNEASSGSYKKNPFWFQHYNLSSISCFLNSVMVNRKPFIPDYDLPYMGELYINFLKVIGQLNNNITTTITPEQFEKGFFLIPWDLTRDNSQGYLTSGYADPPLKNSNLRFQVQFKNALPETISAIIYCIWDSMTLIDSMKNALVDAD